MNIALFGSGEFTDAVKSIDQYLIDTFSIKSLAVIPAAAGREKDARKWIDMAISHYAAFDIKVVPVDIYNRTDANNPDLVELITDVDCVFFSGGDPNYLFDVLNGSRLWRTLINRLGDGVLLAGSSAGAMVLGSHILKYPFRAILSSKDVGWTKAFGLIDYVVFPHFDRFKQHQKLFQKIFSFNDTFQWLGIDEDTAIIFTPSGNKILGQGEVEIHDR